MYQDVHLSDKNKWNNVQLYWSNDSYTQMLQALQDSALSQKIINAAMFSAICTELVRLQNQYFNDTTFKKDVIKVSTTPPSGLTTGQVYFKLN